MIVDNEDDGIQDDEDDYGSESDYDDIGIVDNDGGDNVEHYDEEDLDMKDDDDDDNDRLSDIY